MRSHHPQQPLKASVTNPNVDTEIVKNHARRHGSLTDGEGDTSARRQ